MTTRQHRPRGGFTLVEILTALTILGIIGALFVRLIIVQSRFSEGQMALRNARTVSRNAMNIMLTDLRMVQDNGGLLAASRESVTVRVPVAFGLLCSTAGGATMSLVPVDSAMAALAQYAGWAYRDSTDGIYRYKDAGTIGGFGSLTLGTTTLCTDSVAGPGILPVSYGTRTTKVITVTDGPSGAPNAGWPVFVYQQMTYKFDSSTAFPHRIGLFRIVKTNDPNAPIKDEIIAPFDTSAKFRFYVLNADTAQSDSPGTTAAALSTVRGLQLVLAGASPRVPANSSQAKQAMLVTGVFFKNRRDP
jgi:prepilin-type N-terminal cleavage/methylation domain-containing protein